MKSGTVLASSSSEKKLGFGSKGKVSMPLLNNFTNFFVITQIDFPSILKNKNTAKVK